LRLAVPGMRSIGIDNHIAKRKRVDTKVEIDR